MKPTTFLALASTLCFCSCVPDTGLNAQDSNPPLITRESWTEEASAAERTALQTTEAWQTIAPENWLEGLTPGYMYPLHMVHSCPNWQSSPQDDEQRLALRARGAQSSSPFNCPGRVSWWEDKTGATYTGPELHKLYQPTESPAEAVSFVQAKEMNNPSPTTLTLPSAEVIQSTTFAGILISNTYYVRRISSLCEGTETAYFRVASDGTPTTLASVYLPSGLAECPLY